MINTSWTPSWNTYPTAVTAYDSSTFVVSTFKSRASSNSQMLPALPFFPSSGWVIYLLVRLLAPINIQRKPVRHHRPGSCGNLQSVNHSAVPDPLHYANLLVHGLPVSIGGISSCLLIPLDCGTWPSPRTHIIRLSMHEAVNSVFLQTRVLVPSPMTLSLCLSFPTVTHKSLSWNVRQTFLPKPILLPAFLMQLQLLPDGDTICWNISMSQNAMTLLFLVSCQLLLCLLQRFPHLPHHLPSSVLLMVASKNPIQPLGGPSGMGWRTLSRALVLCMASVSPKTDRNTLVFCPCYPISRSCCRKYVLSSFLKVQRLSNYICVMWMRRANIEEKLSKFVPDISWRKVDTHYYE